MHDALRMQVGECGREFCDVEPHGVFAERELALVMNCHKEVGKTDKEHKRLAYIVNRRRA